LRDLSLWKGRFIERDHVTLYRPGLWQTDLPKLTWWRNSLAAAHARILQRWATRAAPGRPIVYAFHPHYWRFVAHLNDAYVVYHADDHFAAMPGWTESDAAMQAALVERADLILATSPGVARSLPGSGSERAHQVPNGADVHKFEGGDQLECPQDLANLPHPRIGYMGNLNEKVDFGLIRELATARRDWQWVFLGRQIGKVHMSAETRQALTDCEALPNIHFLGHRPRNSLPAYVGHMDVNIMCYRTGGNGWWRDVYPLKLHEYLAAGKPVVSAALEVVKQFTSVLAIATNTAQWMERTQHAVEQGGIGSPHERISVARNNTWDKRVDLIESLILNDVDPASASQGSAFEMRRGLVGGNA
jgi:glycosyltransferase involved in cell wall biosynthesis